MCLKKLVIARLACDDDSFCITVVRPSEIVVSDMTIAMQLIARHTGFCFELKDDSDKQCSRIHFGLSDIEPKAKGFEDATK